jgi:hypothetical protein
LCATHLHIKEHPIWLEGSYRIQELLALASLSHNLDVRLLTQQCAQTSAHKTVFIGNQHA